MAATFSVTREARSFVSPLVWELGMKCEEHLEALEQLPGGCVGVRKETAAHHGCLTVTGTVSF